MTDRPTEPETEREWMLHAMYDAWIDLQREAELSRDTRFAGVARAILSGQLKAAGYLPFLRTVEDVEGATCGQFKLPPCPSESLKDSQRVSVRRPTEGETR